MPHTRDTLASNSSTGKEMLGIAYKMVSFCQLKYRRVGSVGMTEHSRVAAVPWLSESMISQGRAHQLLPAHPCLPIGKFFVVQTGWWS